MKPLPEKIGKYKIDSLLGRGGMGQVYKAHDPSLARDVALKIMVGPALDDTSARERFIREGQAAGGLRHPNIVTVYDLGEVDDQMFIAMELIGGNDLELIIRTRTPLSIEDKLNVMIQVCEGISYAHKRDVVHRDLKPSNIRIDEEGIAKIMDFGIAKLGSSTMTATGTVMGTPFYMSPEQVRGIRVDSRSDIFSLGAILYELFTYQKAFPGEMSAVFYKILHEQPEPLASFMDVPAETLQEIVDKSMQKEKSNRFQTAAEFADLLRKAQETYRQGRIATLCGIKTTVQADATMDFQITPAPAAVSTRKPLTVPAIADAASVPTKLVDATPQPSGTGPTEVIGRSLPPATPAAPAPLPVVAAKRSPLIYAFAGMVIVLLLGGGGVYWYLRSGGSVTDGKKEAPDITRQLAEAKQLFQAGKYDDAITLYTQLITTNPNDANLHFLLAASKQKNLKQQEALLEYQKAVELDPKLDKAWQQIGLLFMNRMDYRGAEEAFLKAVSLNPNSAPAWEGLAQTYLQTQQTDKEENAYKRLLALEPQNVAAIYNLGLLYSGKKDTAAARESFKKVLEINPNYAEAHNNLGTLYLSEGLVAQSIIENEKAVRLKPGLPSAHYSLFLAYDQQKDYSNAKDHLAKFLELTGDDDPELKQKLQEYSRL